MMDKRLDVKIERIDNVIHGYVAHIDDSLRGSGTLAEYGRHSIYSDTKPGIYGGFSLDVLGTKKAFDNNRFAYAYMFEDDAITAVQRFEKMIDAINNPVKDKVLEIELKRYGTLVYGKCLQVDDKLRKEGFSFNHKGWVVSSEMPAIHCENYLYIPENDVDSVFYKDYETEELAQEAIIKFQELISKVNQEHKPESDLRIYV